MPWVRFDDQFTIHRKVKGLSDAAYRLHTEGIFWCARNLTDGFVPAADLADVATARRPLRHVPELVARKSWHEAGAGCDSEQCPAGQHAAAGLTAADGWVIHDYWDYQPSKEKVLRERKAKAERQRRWDQKRRGQAVDKPCGELDASRDASRDAAPPRPEGSGGGRPRASGASGRPAPTGPAVRAVPEWCGECHEGTRMLDLDDGRVARCPRCHPNAQAS